MAELYGLKRGQVGLAKFGLSARCSTRVKGLAGEFDWLFSFKSEMI